MVIEVFDPQSLIPWRLHAPRHGQTRQMLIVIGKIYVRTDRADEHTTNALLHLQLTLAWIDSKGGAVPYESASEEQTAHRPRLIAPDFITSGPPEPQ